jgi:hypothetical protein
MAYPAKSSSVLTSRTYVVIGKLSGGSFLGARSKYAKRSGAKRDEFVITRTPVLVPGT